jgi:hypothetical protein
MTKPQNMQPKTGGRPKSKKTILEEKRKNRIPMDRVQKLQVPIPAGYVGRWFNDTQGGRVQQAIAAGWRFLTAEEMKVQEDDHDRGTALSRHVGANRDGSSQQAYLMVIEKELYDEDQKAKQDRLDQQDKELMSAVPDKTDENQYAKAGNAITR